MERDEQPSIPECVDSLRRSSHSDRIAFGVGALAFLVGYLVYPRIGRSTPPAIVASITLLLSAFLAGVISGFRTKADSVPGSLVAPSAIRWGGRIGLICFLVGSSSLILGLFVNNVRGGTWADSRMLAISPSALGLSTLVIILPTIISGAFGTLVGLGQLRSAPRQSLPAPPPAKKGPAGAKHALVLASVIFVLSLLVSDLRATWLRKGFPLTSNFNYEAPPTLATAEAGQWQIIASRPVPGLSLASRLAVSSTGHLIAYTDQKDPGFTVFDLKKGQIQRRFSTAPVAGLAWSPTNDRIFYISAADSSCWVLTPASGTTVLLPVRGQLPNGSPVWESEREVVFKTGSLQVGRLDLETLTTRSPKAYGDRGTDSGSAVGCLAETEKCRVTFRPRVHALVSPLEAGAGTWSFESSAAICVVDKEHNEVFNLVPGSVVPYLPNGLLQEHRILVSPDVSMITLLTASGAMTHYVGIREQPSKAALEITLPKAPDLAESSPLEKLTTSGKIGAFICAPLINPLNQKVIGPDPRHVKALAFSTGWKEGRGKLTVAETYLPIAPGDIAGYLHHWKDGEPSLLAGGGWENWWSTTSLSNQADSDAISTSWPWQKAELFSYQNGIGFHGWISNYRDQSHPPVSDILQLAKTPPKPKISLPAFLRPQDRGEVAQAEPKQPKAEVPKPEVPKTEPAKSTGEQAVVESFVIDHHAKVTAGDLEGFVVDYAARVDFNDKGVVSSDFIRKDQAAYLPKYDQLSESVIGPIQLTPIEQGWQANYTIRSFAISKRDGKEHDRKVKITLEIGQYSGGVLLIHKERASVEN